MNVLERKKLKSLVSKYQSFFCVRYTRSDVLKNPAIIDMIEFFLIILLYIRNYPYNLLFKIFVPCRVHLDHQFEVFLNSV